MTVADFIASLELEEIWRVIPGYEPYEVSSHGRVRSQYQIIKTVMRDGEKYPFFTPSIGNVKSNLTVHRAMAFAFLGDPPFDGAIVAHNDGDTENLRISNFRWTTFQDNSADIDRHGNRPKGSEVVNAKLTEEKVSVIKRLISEGVRYPKIAAEFDVSISTISLIKRERIWKHVH